MTEWANASRQELNNIERTRSDRQEAQKRKFSAILLGGNRAVVDENETSLDFTLIF